MKKRKRVYIKKGDIFKVQITEKKFKCFQYIADDYTQLNSQVIKVFKNEFTVNAFSTKDILSYEVDLYAHTVIKVGIWENIIEKMGSCPEVGNTENIFFRSTLDYGIRRGDPVIEYTANWRIWKINEPMVNVIGLNKEMAQYDIGLVFYICNIIDRMKTGEYTMKYPQPIIVDKPVIVGLSP